MDINYGLVDSPLGLVLAAESDNGVCFTGLWDQEAYLLNDLEKRFPKANLIRDPGLLLPVLASLLAYLEGRQKILSMKLDLSGTPFQISVWTALRQVPYGTTLSYTQLAASMGLGPNSARAVARGCATNPVSLVIPCHRILRKDGSLGGYYWGLERKRALLEMEGALPKQKV